MGTYRKEWSCCGSVTETDAWEPETCPFCTATPSPIPASDAELPPLPVPDMYLWWDTFGIQRMGGKAPEHYHAMSFFSLRQMRDYARTAFTRTASEPIAWGAWRKSLGRFHILSDDKAYIERVYGAESDGEGADFEIIPLAASDTRTAAGEAECDAALRAAPASQQYDERFDCPACRGSGEGVMMEGGGPDAYEVPCLCAHCGGSGALDDAYRGVCVLLSAERGKYLRLCAEVCAAEFTSSPVPRMGGNTQPVSVESARPAEVDVEAERPRFEAALIARFPYLNQNVAFGRLSGGEYTLSLTETGWQMWLAARTQADAGKDADTLRAELLRLRGWFESQARVISKGGGSSWDMAQCREQIESIDATTKPENP